MKWPLTTLNQIYYLTVLASPFCMNYLIEFRKFITGQYLNKGVRITAATIIPAMVLYHYDWLSFGIAMPLGALMVSMADTPGPIHHRRNGMLACNLLNFAVAITVGITRTYPWLLALEITLFGFVFSMAGIYGNRVNSIGLSALFVMVLSIDVHHLQDRVFVDALFMLGGGVWYMILSLVLYSIRPYQLIQQALGESLTSIASYLKEKARLYEIRVDYDEVYRSLVPLQVEIQHQQEQLREILYKTRDVTKESTSKSRSLLMMFLDSLDLFEQIMTSQQNHESLHRLFDGTGLLDKFRMLIFACGDALEGMGLAVQMGSTAKENSSLEDLIASTENAFIQYREQHLDPSNLEGFISLRHILNNIKDINDRMKRLRMYSSFSDDSTRNIPINVDLGKFVSTHELDPKLFIENLSAHSNVFRHAIRISLSMLAGYLIAQLFPFGHSYWILLTILTILKPAYSISRRRNADRLGGTLAGAVLSFLFLYYIHSNQALFGMTIVAMIAAYSFLQINYFVSVAGITVYVLLSFHFLHPVDFRSLVVDRVIDTGIGSAISFIASLFILPRWEHEQVAEYINELLKANLSYFHTVTKSFYSAPALVQEYKYARKQANVSLANLSDAFQRSLSEPATGIRAQTLLQQLVVANHMLTSHIASLSFYAKSLADQYRSPAFRPVIEAIENKMQTAIQIAIGNSDLPIPDSGEANNEDAREIVRELWNRRVKELEEGRMNTEDSNTRKLLSGLKTITDQFEIIQTIIADIIHILQRMDHPKPSKGNSTSI
jgi:uncharacterized membrane protein (TIGR01666 family)